MHVHAKRSSTLVSFILLSIIAALSVHTCGDDYNVITLSPEARELDWSNARAILLLESDIHAP